MQKKIINLFYKNQEIFLLIFAIISIVVATSYFNYQKKYPFINKVESFLHKRINIIIANSNEIKKQLIETEKITEDKCKVIYNGISINKKRIPKQ